MKVLNNLKSTIRHQINDLSYDGLRKIFDKVDQLGVKRSVDKVGLDKFINQCAFLAAGTGALSGTGGALTMAVGIPLDLINLITQQFRVTLAVIYYYRGGYHVSFEEFIRIVATSMSVDAGVMATKTMMENIAKKMMFRLGTKTARKLVPVIGGLIGGSANYLFIKRVAESVKEMHT